MRFIKLSTVCISLWVASCADDAGTANPSAAQIGVATHGLEAQALEAQALEAQASEAQALEAQPLEAQPLEAQPLEAQPLEAQPLDAPELEEVAFAGDPPSGDSWQGPPVASAPTTQLPVKVPPEACLVCEIEKSKSIAKTKEVQSFARAYGTGVLLKADTRCTGTVTAEVTNAMMDKSCKLLGTANLSCVGSVLCDITFRGEAQTGASVYSFNYAAGTEIQVGAEFSTDLSIKIRPLMPKAMNIQGLSCFSAQDLAFTKCADELQAVVDELTKQADAQAVKELGNIVATRIKNNIPTADDGRCGPSTPWVANCGYTWLCPSYAQCGYECGKCWYGGFDSGFMPSAPTLTNGYDFQFTVEPQVPTDTSKSCIDYKFESECLGDRRCVWDKTDEAEGPDTWFCRAR